MHKKSPTFFFFSFVKNLSMGEAIRGLNEIFGRDMEGERKLMLSKGNCGLGPPDLILVIKEINGMEKKYYHHVYGIKHESQQNFIDYFETLKRNQFPFSNSKFKIKSATCFVYDSISHRDYCIPSYHTKINVNWKNLHISSILRFYRHDSSLIYALFGGIPSEYTLSVTLPLFEITMEEIEYAADIFSNFTSTNEHQLAIARALICTQDTRKIMKFLHTYSNQLPNILVHIAKIIPSNAVIVEGLFFLIESHLDLYSDDLESVFAVCSHYISTGQTVLCKRFVPLLMQTLSEHPQSAICLARICTAEKRFSDAFSFLNIAALSKGWQMPGLTPDIDKNFMIIGSPYPMAHSELEKRIVENPVTGRTQAYFEAIEELMVSMGTHEFLNIATSFAQAHASFTEFDDCPEHPFYYSDSCRSKDEFYLYDPGVENEAHVACDLRRLPYSSRFQEMIKRVMDDHVRIARLSSGRKTSYKGSDLLLAVRMKDGVIANAAFEYLKANNRLSGAGIMLMLRASLLGIVTFDINTQPSILTVEQASVLPFARGLIQRIMQLERLYL